MLTRQGARRLTSMLDRLASVIQENPDILGVNSKIAQDFAYRCDLLSDAIETRAVQNFPRQASENCESCGEYADEDFESFEEAARKNTPPSYAKPDCGPDASSQEWGMKDSTSPTYHKNYDSCYHKVTRPGPKKTASREHIVGTDRKAWFDPATIADEVPGPLEHLDDDEQWIDDHFTQEKYDELQTVQEDGDLGPQPYVTPSGKTASHHGFYLTSK